LGLLLISCSIEGCGGSHEPSAPADQPAQKPPSKKPDVVATEYQDITFGMETSVAPGAEEQLCKVVQMPLDRGEIAVPSAESHFTVGSHHFLAYRTSLTSMPDGGGDMVDCLDSNPVFITGSYFESQQPDMIHALPDGIAHVFKPGEIVLLQTHYLNTTSDQIDAKIRFTLHTMDPAKVVHEAGSILFSNFRLKIPPRSQVTQTQTCPVSNIADMHLLQLWSHMHSRAVHFVATTDDPELSGAPIYESHTWSEPQPRSFDQAAPSTVHIGSHITFSCDYDNDTDSTFTYGPSAAKNEMCILHGMYWPRVDTLTEFCFGAGLLPPGLDGGQAPGAD
jgi:hypothetical protein